MRAAGGAGRASTLVIGYAEVVNPEQRAETEERVAVVEEQTEQRLHAVAPMLPDPGRVHERASALTERAEEHLEEAERLRNDQD